MDKLVQQWSKVPPKQRYALVALIAVGLLAGYYYLYYGEASERVQALSEQYTTLESQRVEKQAYVDNLAKYEARINELQQQLNEARAKLPDQADVPQLLAQLGNKGRQLGLAIDRFQPGSETPAEFYATIAFAVEARGSYHEVGMFLDAVGSLDRIVNVTDISLTDPKTENQKVVVKSQFNLSTYRFLGGEAKAPGGKK
jgi:type IV pilus assembly protein PilO